MPKFSIYKNGKFLCNQVASGNLAALCNYLEIEGFPHFPISTHEGRLYAKVDWEMYVVIDFDLYLLGSPKRILSPKSLVQKTVQLLCMSGLQVQRGRYVV